MAADDDAWQRDPNYVEAQLAHLWRQYEATRDSRSTRGDVDLLAEAAELNQWPGAPELGAAIAEALRASSAKRSGPSRADVLLRNREICELAKTMQARGLSARKSHEELATWYGMTPDAVKKVIERAGDECGNQVSFGFWLSPNDGDK